MTPGDWITLAVGLGAAAVAIWSVIVAHRANGRADIANHTADEANRIARESVDAQKLSLPPAWSAAQDLGHRKVVFQNTSGRNIRVESLASIPTRWHLLSSFS